MTSSSPGAWAVHKFGGSSVADTGCFQRVAAILDAQPAGRMAVVLSACKGVTDALLGLVAMAERQDPDYRLGIESLRARHATIAENLLPADAARLYMSAFDRDCHDIEGILHTVRLIRSASDSLIALVSGYGEIWSTRLFHEFYERRRVRAGEVRWVDARQAVVVSGVRSALRCSGLNPRRSSRPSCRRTSRAP